MKRLAVAVLCAALLTGCGEDSPTPDEQLSAFSEAIEGIPQDGFTLGRPEAPATLTAYARPTDFAFEEWVLEDLPELADELRAGEVKLQVRTVSSPLSVAGTTSDNEQLARLLQAAGLQDRFYDLLGAVSAHYAGYLDEFAVTDLLREVEGLSARDVRAFADDDRISAAIERANENAARLGRVGVRRWTLSLTEGAPPQVLRTPDEVEETVSRLR